MKVLIVGKLPPAMETGLKGLGLQVALAPDPLGQTKVGHVRLAFAIDQDVRRFEVAVQNAVLMGVMNRPGDGSQNPRGGPGATNVVFSQSVEL